jgi:asparagine synthase (glutamine-hydrolysing)
MSDVLPAEVLQRPKRGFAPPVEQWHAALFAAYGESLRDGFLTQSGILNEEISGCLARGSFPEGEPGLAFKALVLEQWCRQMIQASRPSS